MYVPSPHRASHIDIQDAGQPHPASVWSSAGGKCVLILPLSLILPRIIQDHSRLELEWLKAASFISEEELEARRG